MTTATKTPVQDGTMAAWSTRKLLERLVAEAEFRRCGRDKRYFLEHYWYIPSQDPTAENEGRTLFRFFPYQERLHALMSSVKRLVIGKSRQIGASTQTMADSAHGLLFYTGRYELLIISKSDEDAETNLGMILHGYTWLPKWMKEKLPERADRATSTLTFRFQSGVIHKAISMVGNLRRGAGKSATRIVADEFALYDHPGGVYRAIEPATLAAIKAWTKELGAAFIVLSTFRGDQNKFAQLYKQAKAGTNGFTPFFVSSRENRFLTPEDMAWEDMTDEIFEELWNAKRLGEYAENPHEFYQDYARTDDEALTNSGERRFKLLPDEAECIPWTYAGRLVAVSGGGYEMKLVGWHTDTASYEAEMENAPFKFACGPKDWDRKKKYVVACDPAGGVGKDYAVAYVMTWGEDEGEKELVASFASNLCSPEEFADRIYALGRYFKGESQSAGLVVVERSSNEVGAVLTRLRTRKYPNLYRYQDFSEKRAALKPIIGWPTNAKTKPEAIACLDKCFRLDVDENGIEFVRNLLLNVDPILREELSVYMIKENRAGNYSTGADVGAHDDRVMAVAIGCAVLDRLPRGIEASKSPETSTKDEFRVTPAVQDGGPFIPWNPLQQLEQVKAQARARAANEAREMARYGI